MTASKSVLNLAKPILDRVGWPATLYVPTDFPGCDTPLTWLGIERWLSGPDESELQCLSWDELRGLVDAGWEIGSHTCSHPHLPGVSDAVLADQLSRSKSTCEEFLATPCTSVAYPYGDVDARVVTAAGQAGYIAGASLPARLVYKGALDWPRIGVYRNDHDLRFRLKLSPSLMRVRGTRSWNAADLLQSARPDR